MKSEWNARRVEFDPDREFNWGAAMKRLTRLRSFVTNVLRPVDYRRDDWYQKQYRWTCDVWDKPLDDVTADDAERLERIAWKSYEDERQGYAAMLERVEQAAKSAVALAATFESANPVEQERGIPRWCRRQIARRRLARDTRAVRRRTLQAASGHFYSSMLSPRETRE